APDDRRDDDADDDVETEVDGLLAAPARAADLAQDTRGELGRGLRERAEFEHPLERAGALERRRAVRARGKMLRRARIGRHLAAGDGLERFQDLVTIHRRFQISDLVLSAPFISSRFRGTVAAAASRGAAAS